MPSSLLTPLSLGLKPREILRNQGAILYIKIIYIYVSVFDALDEVQSREACVGAEERSFGAKRRGSCEESGRKQMMAV